MRSWALATVLLFGIGPMIVEAIDKPHCVRNCDTYAQGSAQAIGEGRDLLVFVGECRDDLERNFPGVRVCYEKEFPQCPGKGVVVLKYCEEVKDGKIHKCLHRVATLDGHPNADMVKKALS
jgi:hypothetical protein